MSQKAVGIDSNICPKVAALKPRDLCYQVTGEFINMSSVQADKNLSDLGGNTKKINPNTVIQWSVKDMIALPILGNLEIEIMNISKKSRVVFWKVIGQKIRIS